MLLYIQFTIFSIINFLIDISSIFEYEASMREKSAKTELPAGLLRIEAFFFNKTCSLSLILNKEGYFNQTVMLFSCSWTDV